VPRFAANLSMLFTERDFLDRFDAAARAGFRGVEYLFPYDHPVDAIGERLERHGLVQVLHNLPAGDWSAGERGIACLPERASEFREGVDRALEYASALGCERLNCLAGIAPGDVPEEVLRQTFVENLRYAAARLADAGVTLLTEPINTRDVPGFHLSGTGQALAVLDAAGAANLRLQYDVYHMQIMEGDLAHTIERHLGRIGHLQIADNPGRHEPGSGEIHYPFLFDHVDGLGYTGWIGCEYQPAITTEAGLDWLRPYLS